jgi:aspartate aminotransferase
MRFASRLDKVMPSVTLGLNARTLELRQQGRDIIALGVGEPDIDTPDEVNEVGIAAIRGHKARYTATAGIPELRNAICSYIERVYGLTYEPTCVMASSGAKQVLFNSILTTAGAGDEVIIPAPYWTSYPEMVHLASATPVLVETTLQEGLKLTPEKLEAALTPRTTALLLNSPSNPSGVTYTRRDLEGLAEVLGNRDVWILSDDIYCTLLFGETEFASMAHIPGFRDRTILINGVSKTFSMTGWRIGFAAGSREAIAAMTRFQDHSTSCPNAIAQYAAAEALRIGPSLTAEWQTALQVRRDLMFRLATEIPGVEVIPPTGAFYLFLDVRKCLNGGMADTLQLAEGLLMEAGVGTIPGEAFGAPGFLRLSFAVSEETIIEGMRRIRTFVENL